MPKEKPQKMPHEKGTGTGPWGSLELVTHRNEFYRDGSHMTMIIVMILIGVNIFTGWFVIHLSNTKPEPRYFATTAQGTLIPPVKLTDKYLDDNQLLTFAMTAATSAYTFDFVNYRSQLQNVRTYFTREGYEKFIQALLVSQNLDFVRRDRLVVTAAPSGAPQIISSRVVDGRYSWVVDMDMDLIYRGNNVYRTQRVTVRIGIFRQPIVDTPTGVGIEQIVMSERGRRPGRR